MSGHSAHSHSRLDSAALPVERTIQTIGLPKISAASEQRHARFLRNNSRYIFAAEQWRQEIQNNELAYLYLEKIIQDVEIDKINSNSLLVSLITNWPWTTILSRSLGPALNGFHIRLVSF